MMSSSLLQTGVISTALHCTVAGPVAKSTMTSQNLFASELFSVLVTEHPSENVVYSPASIQTCLAFAYTGAGGDTAEDMRTVLKLGEGDKRQVAQNYGEFLKTSFWSPKANAPKLKMANRLFVNENLKIADDFNQISNEFFEAQAENVNFENSQVTADGINSWVEQQTENRIKNVVSPSAFGGDTSAILVNAIYFKGEWQIPFSADDTTKKNFQISQNQQATVDMMYQNLHFNYVELPEYDAKALELPYKNSDLSMLIILPNEVEGLKNLETKLSGVDLNDITSKMSSQEVDVYLPKFRIELDFDLVEPLQKMGLTSMFSKSANFSHLFADGSTHRISDVNHKAFVEVDETGTVAAASTAIHFKTLGLLSNKKIFNVDHPFFFAIRSKTAVYFAGHVVKF